MTIEELLDFCKKRKVAVMTTYSEERHTLVVIMFKETTKGTFRTYREFTPQAAASAGFWFPLRAAIWRMADELDKEEKRNEQRGI